MGDSNLIPWSEVHSWSCVACGNCCLGYKVPLKMEEYVQISSIYGFKNLNFGIGRVYLKNGLGNRCIFQKPSLARWFCSLQRVKPLACKLFPFRVYSKPLYKRGDLSEFQYGNKNFYIYLDLDCKGISVGRPSDRFTKKILPEIVQIGTEQRFKQKFSTSKYFL